MTLNWDEIAAKIIVGAILGAAGFLCAWAGRKVSHTIDRLDKIMKDHDAIFPKIRAIEQQLEDYRDNDRHDA